VREMVKELKEFGVEAYGYDPLLSKEEIEGFGVNALDNFNGKVDGVIVAAAHDEFREITFDKLKRMMNDNPILIDIRGIFNNQEAKKKGFYYSRL